MHILYQSRLQAKKVIPLCTSCSVPQVCPPICNLSLSTKRRGGLYAAYDIFSRDYALSQSRNVGSVDAGFVLALPFHHGDLEPGYVRVSTRVRVRGGIKTPVRLSAKNAGGAGGWGGLCYVRGGAYLRDTMVPRKICV